MRKVIALLSAVLIAVLVVVVVILNWKPRTYRVTGTITRAGKALEWKGTKGVLQIIFVPASRSRSADIYRCEGDAKVGTYVLPNVPAGTYRVSIQQMDPYPTHDLLQFTYGLKNSPLVREVANDCEINFDLPEELP